MSNTPAVRAFAVWYRHAYPLAVYPAAYAWQLLDRATKALWEDIAQAVLTSRQEPTHGTP